ncbi:MAG TPA: adenylate/guanylate cyclase domain-containing protein, partial [Candidatus Nanopelagicales bacterium]|nr:adenylate/guanylate cyclase domain-containing protein [Candidatus Nanopelagicales bacterium]
MGVDLTAYLPPLLRTWWRDEPDQLWREVEGTLVFVDISGFTQLTERLARRGKVGAEELSDILDSTFTGLLQIAYDVGGSLLKWGGDAVLLLFDGALHEVRGAAAAHRMRARLRTIGKVRTSAGRANLQLSVGVHSGRFSMFLVGDPRHHRELVIAGPEVSRTAAVEAAAVAGEIGLSERTAQRLPARCVARVGERFVLAAAPDLPAHDPQPGNDEPAPDLGGLLTPRIREHLTQAHLVGPEHRKAAVAFVRFSGSDELLARKGLPELARALDDLVRSVQAACTQHGVTFLESDIDDGGGKLMLVAGAPRSHGHDEDDLLHALRAVVERPGELAVQIGVARGPVFLGQLGPAFARTYSVKGDTVNLAARLGSAAEPGQILATAPVLEHASTRFDTEPMAPLAVKGKSAPVLAESVGRSRRRAGPRRGVTGPLLGRDSELAALQAALRVAQAGHGRTVDLVGAAGIGKSRLVEELLRDDAVTGYLCRCEEYDADTPYRPFQALLRDLLALAADAGPADVGAALRAAAGNVDPASLPWLPLIGRVLDVELAGTPEVEGLAEEFRAARLEESTARFLAHLLPANAVVVFDDAQLMDEASIGVLDGLRRAVAELPVLVVLTRREVADGYLPHGDGIVTIRPGLLDLTDSALLIHELSSGELTAAEIATISARAGGNPLFLQGLVQAARTGAAVGDLPDTVEALVTSEIDRLPPAERTVLRYASVLGVGFHESELRELLTGQPLPSSTDSLIRLSYFLHTEGHGRYRFEHQLVRDTAYEGLPYRLRRKLHGIAAETIESAATDPDEVAELLSLHFLHAARPDRAWQYSRIAGDRAVAKYAYVQAEQMYSRAVTAATGMTSVPDLEVRQVLIALGDAQYWTGRQQEALRSFRRARALVGDDDVAGALLLRREAEIVHRQGRSSSALRTVTIALGRLRTGEDADHLVARSRLERLYAKIRETQGRYKEALRWAGLAQQHADASGDLAARAEALEIVQVAHSMLGRGGEQAYGEQALALYERLDDRIGQSRTLNNLAVHAWLQGRGATALQMFERSAELAEQAGDSVGVAETRFNIADTMVRLGRAAQAAALLRALL